MVDIRDLLITTTDNVFSELVVPVGGFRRLLPIYDLPHADYVIPGLIEFLGATDYVKLLKDFVSNDFPDGLLINGAKPDKIWDPTPGLSLDQRVAIASTLSHEFLYKAANIASAYRIDESTDEQSSILPVWEFDSYLIHNNNVMSVNGVDRIILNPEMRDNLSLVTKRIGGFPFRKVFQGKLVRALQKHYISQNNYFSEESKKPSFITLE